MDLVKLGEAFVKACQKDPFIRDHLASLGVELPEASTSSKPAVPKVTSTHDNNEDDVTWNDEEIVESDLELDEADVVESDQDDALHKMGDPSVEVTEQSRHASQEAKGMAMEAISKGKLEEAVEHLTKAILLNPTYAIMYGTRASVFVKMNKPAAAIRDANAALEINPEFAKGYKTRGMANAMLGKWEAAAHDLHAASNIDYDDEISAVLKKVKPNAHKIVEHRRKYERLRKEREEKNKRERPLKEFADAFHNLGLTVGPRSPPMTVHAFLGACFKMRAMITVTFDATNYLLEDLNGKIDQLRNNASNDATTLAELMDQDKANKCVKFAASNCRLILRLRSGIGFLKIMFQELLKGKDVTLEDAAEIAYKGTFAASHDSLYQSLVLVSIADTPTRREIRHKIKETQDQETILLQRYVDGSTIVIDYLEELFNSKDVATDW